MHSITVLEERMQRRRVQTPYLRVRLQADSPVYSILNCDAWTHTQGIWYFAKVTPVDLKQILEDKAETGKKELLLWVDIWNHFETCRHLLIISIMGRFT